METLKTYRGTIDERGEIRFEGPRPPAHPAQVLVTVLGEKEAGSAKPQSMPAPVPTHIQSDWLKTEEREAWSYLQVEP